MPAREKGEKLSSFIGRFVKSKRDELLPIKRPTFGYDEARKAVSNQRKRG